MLITCFYVKIHTFYKTKESILKANTGLLPKIKGKWPFKNSFEC